MPNETETETAPAEKAPLSTLLEPPAPKDGGGATSAEGKGTPAPDAKDSETSSSTTDDRQLSPDELIEKAAQLERANTLRQKELDRKLKEADDAKALVEEQRKKYDEGLAKQAKLMLASEKLTKGQKKEALKEFLGDAWNPAELMEELALEFPAGEGETETKEEKPLADQVNELLDAREKKKAEDAAEAQRKADEEKKTAEEKRLADDRNDKVNRWKDAAVESVEAESHPLLKAKLDQWIDDFGEAKGREMMRDKLMTLFYDTYTGHKRALDPDEAATLAEMQLAEKSEGQKRSPIEIIEAEAEELDEAERKRERSSGVVRRDEPAPRRKAREEMTALDLVGDEADEIDRRGGRGRIFESDL